MIYTLGDRRPEMRSAEFYVAPSAQLIGRFSIVAAGALVPPDKVIPEGVVVMGAPAKIVREVTEEDRQHVAHAAEVYRARGREYRSLLKPA